MLGNDYYKLQIIRNATEKLATLIGDKRMILEKENWKEQEMKEFYESVETKQIEIDCRESYAVIDARGDWVAIFKYKSHAELFGEGFGGKSVDFQIQQIKEKVPFK